VKLLSVLESRELDRLSQQKYGVPSYQLMTNAGEAVAQACVRNWPETLSGTVKVIAGRGNNGGDGMVAARRLRQQGATVDVILLAKSEQIKGDAARALYELRQTDARLIEATDEPALTSVVTSASLIIDAIFGTGLNANVEGLAARAIGLINEAKVPVVAVDIPSGVNADTGAIMGIAVRASLTVTFGLAKFGHVSYPGADYCGRLEIVDIGFAPQALDEIAPKGRFLEADDVRPAISPRPTNAHKGLFGHPLIIAGSRGKAGAAVLAARGALRIGAGLVTVAYPEGALPGLTIVYPELMAEPMPERDGHFDGRHTIERLREVGTGKNVFVVGPGIGVSSDTQELVAALVEEFCSPARPLVIDADGLNVLAALGPRLLRKAAGPVLLTPHPGEMGRLLACSTEQINANRIGAARRLSEETGAIVLLKGARSVIAAPDGTVLVNSTGNPGMGTPGMGDVLSGVLGGLLAQRLKPLEAMALGVFVHGYAADRLAKNLAPIGFTAGDVIEELPRALAAVAAQAC